MVYTSVKWQQVINIIVALESHQWKNAFIFWINTADWKYVKVLYVQVASFHT